MATPNITGSLMLLQQLYGKLKAGKRMRAATIKALAIHTAREAGAKPGPDYQFGWGLINAEAAADFLVQENDVENRLIESVLLQGTTHEFYIQPVANKKVTLTICWTDPEGNPVPNALDPPDRMLVNDLDIRLIDEDGTVILPWVLNPTVPQAQATKGDNIRDNVEKIEFETPLQKRYSILVRHKGSLKFGKQDYSLAVSYAVLNNSSKTFYWIGNSGAWNDVQNWSLTQRGSPSIEIPDNNDVVVFDASSLAANDVIDLTEDAACARFIWLANEQVTLNMAGHNLTIGEQLIISSNKLSCVGGGIVKFNTAIEGIANFLDNDFSTTEVEFEQGNWILNGSCTFNKVLVKEGSHQWMDTNIHANEVTVLSPLSWDISGARLTISSTFNLPQNTFAFSSEKSLLLIENTGVKINWNTHNYQGRISIAENSDLTMSGGNKIKKLSVKGKLLVEDSFVYDTLHLLAGAQWVIANNKTQTVLSEIDIESSIVKPIAILAQSKATLHIGGHQKRCFEYITISNVDLTGQSALNAGLTSVVTNSKNWLQMACEEVLFANFTVDFLCEGAMTRFADISEGMSQRWEWNFGDALSSENTSADQNPSHVFSTKGIFEVTLTVEKETQVQSFTKSVEIGENTLSENAITRSNDQLTSVLTAQAYQWYKEGIQIENATARSLPFQDDAGLYEVVITQDVCNRISSSYLVTSVKDNEQSIDIFPNPADTFFSIEHTKNSFSNEALLKNNVGQIINVIEIEKPVLTQHLQEGLYFLQLKTSHGETLTKKLAVKH
jgi:hypothetical protein